MSIKLPNEPRLSRIPTPVLVGAWVLAVVVAAGCLFWALLGPWSKSGEVASVSATPTKSIKTTAQATKLPPAASTSKPASTPASTAKALTPAPTSGSKPASQPAAPTPITLPLNEVFGYGIQVNGLNDFEAPEGSMGMVAKLQMNWIKQQVQWGLFEPEPGKLDWVILDRLVRKANKSGVKVMLSIVSSPKWTHPAIAPDKEQDPAGIKAPPDDLQAYANFVGQIIDHYKSQGYVIHAVEVWNEQNLMREWRTSPQKIDATRYMQMLKLAYKTIKAKDPNIIVISGALSPTGVDNGVDSVDDFKYLQQMVDLGLLSNADCIGIHHNGYNIGPNVPYLDAPKQPKAATAFFRGPFNNVHHSWSFYTTLNESARIVNRQKPLCITEFGWPSSEGVTTPVRDGFGFSKDNSLQDQANYIIQAFQLMRQWGFVKLAFLWNLNFFNVTDDPSTTDNAIYSILTSTGLPRPAFDELEKMPKP